MGFFALLSEMCFRHDECVCGRRIILPYCVPGLSSVARCEVVHHSYTSMIAAGSVCAGGSGGDLRGAPAQLCSAGWHGSGRWSAWCDVEQITF